MKYITKFVLIFFLGFPVILFSCAKESEKEETPLGDQIIADHRAVDNFNNIPEKYLNEVKKMVVSFPGESHSGAYWGGLVTLELADNKYAVEYSNSPLAYTDKYLRNCFPVFAPGVGEEEWFTWKAWPAGKEPIEKNYIKNLLNQYYNNGTPINLMGFAWCWDMNDGWVSSETDPFFGVAWYGVSVGGPDDNGEGYGLEWGLDESDYAITGNRVCMDTYLSATQDYINFCIEKGYPTKVAFTTGPNDKVGEQGYQTFIKHNYIRDYVEADPTRILFDYADILSYENGSSTPSTATYNGHIFPVSAPANDEPEETGHISITGAVRLAKAQWWLLARIAGWDGL
jgi:hypothetical protein